MPKSNNIDTQRTPSDAFLPQKKDHHIDKFKDHLVNGAKLAVRDQKYFEKMKKACSWASKMFNPAQVVTMLFKLDHTYCSPSKVVHPSSQEMMNSLSEARVSRQPAVARPYLF